MGKLLQIRVSAWTYREEDVVRAWPALTALAWPRPQYPDEKRGVLDQGSPHCPIFPTAASRRSTPLK